MERFDKFQPEKNKPATPVDPAPTTNGAHNSAVKEEPDRPTTSNKRKSVEDDDDEELSEVEDPSPPKKVKKTPKKETDEEIAKRMQAELNASIGRSTRGGGATRKKPVAKKEKKAKKKSAARVKSADDSEIDSDGSEKPEKEKKGGFHVRYTLPIQTPTHSPNPSSRNQCPYHQPCKIYSAPRSCRGRRLSSKYGPTSKSAICRIPTISAISCATRSCARSSRRRRCICSL